MTKLGDTQRDIICALALVGGEAQSRHALMVWLRNGRGRYNEYHYRPCRTLARRGLVTYEPYGPIRLTPDGEAYARREGWMLWGKLSTSSTAATGQRDRSASPSV